MPSRPQANPNDISLVDRLWAAATGHPGMSFLLLLGLAIALYGAGILTPVDWWGAGVEGR